MSSTRIRSIAAVLVPAALTATGLQAQSSHTLSTSASAPVVISGPTAIQGFSASALGYHSLRRVSVSRDSTPNQFVAYVSAMQSSSSLFPIVDVYSFCIPSNPNCPNPIVANPRTEVNCSGSRDLDVIVSDGRYGNSGAPTKPLIHVKDPNDSYSDYPLGCPSGVLGQEAYYLPHVLVKKNGQGSITGVFVSYADPAALGGSIQSVEINIDPNWTPGGGLPCPNGRSGSAPNMGMPKGMPRTVCSHFDSTPYLGRTEATDVVADSSGNRVGYLIQDYDLAPTGATRRFTWVGSTGLDRNGAQKAEFEPIPPSPQNFVGSSLGGTLFMTRPNPLVSGDTELVRVDTCAISVGAASPGLVAELNLVLPFDYPDNQGFLALLLGTPGPALAIPGFAGLLHLDVLAGFTAVFGVQPVQDAAARVLVPVPVGISPGFAVDLQGVVIETSGPRLGILTNLTQLVVLP